MKGRKGSGGNGGTVKGGMGTRHGRGGRAQDRDGLIIERQQQNSLINGQKNLSQRFLTKTVSCIGHEHFTGRGDVKLSSNDSLHHYIFYSHHKSYMNKKLTILVILKFTISQ